MMGLSKFQLRLECVCLTLIVVLMASAYFVDLGQANPFLYEQVSSPVSPPPEVQPPSISIFSPKNEALFVSGNVSLNFNVSVVVPIMPELFYYYLYLSDVYYKASWLPNSTHLDLAAVQNSIPPTTRTFSNDSLARWGTYWTLSGYELNPNFSINLTGVPAGHQSIEVFAVERGSCKYSESGITIRYGTYTITGSSVVNFTVDNISTLSPQNITYSQNDVPLLFKVNDSYAQYSYQLDGKNTMPISGNATLTKLSNGEHNATIYATNQEGNTGASETIYFTVNAPEPFPTALVAAVSGASATAACIGLVVYFKKRH